MKFMSLPQIFEANHVTPNYVILPIKSRLSGKILLERPQLLSFIFHHMHTSMMYKFWFPGPYITYFSKCQEFEANHSHFVKKLRFSVILGVFLQENLTFLTMVGLSPL